MEYISNMDVKIFTTTVQKKQGFWPSSAESTVCSLEAEVNLWLATKPDIEIKNITQSQSGGSFLPATLTISIWYT